MKRLDEKQREHAEAGTENSVLELFFLILKKTKRKCIPISEKNKRDANHIQQYVEASQNKS